MANKILRVVILFLVIIGIILGIGIALKRSFPNLNITKNKINVLEKIQSQNIEIDKIYTYGRCLSIEGKIKNVSKDNFESVKIYITDGEEYEKSYELAYDFENQDLKFSPKEINNGIILDNLDYSKDYYVLIRLKLNNSVDAKFYTLNNTINFNSINYYTVTKNNLNKKVIIAFDTQTYKGTDYELLKISFEEDTLPDDVYDFVIDAGHGGKDIGYSNGTVNEATLDLDYAKSLKEALEKLGYKVKLTRDETNSDTFTEKNTYDVDGRIGIACATRAKLMISFHVSDDSNKTIKGLEIYAPCKSNLLFAQNMANNIVNDTSLEYSNNTAFKKLDGVYVKNYTESNISTSIKTANKNGYEPYDITTSTPFLFTIREVGGLATEAFMDGRNTAYAKNQYYDSNQGIECYQINMGYIKTDIDVLLNEKDSLINGIVEAIKANY